MSKRCVVNVATTDHYRRGAKRLFLSPYLRDCGMLTWPNLPSAWPQHSDKPYAFKAFAMKETADKGYDTLLWADACILPVADMKPLWERIERDGYWFARNGFTNYEWTADSAYPDLFAPELERGVVSNEPQAGMAYVRELNKEIPHVVATAFGLNLRSEIGAAFLKEYFRLASETRAFCGPWTNANVGDTAGTWAPGTDPVRVAPCGPSDVRGHRHDQSCASVIAWRLGMKLTDPPLIFAYGKEGEIHDERTILLADGSYE